MRKQAEINNETGRRNVETSRKDAESGRNKSGTWRKKLGVLPNIMWKWTEKCGIEQKKMGQW